MCIVYLVGVPAMALRWEVVGARDAVQVVWQPHALAVWGQREGNRNGEVFRRTALVRDTIEGYKWDKIFLLFSEVRRE